MEYKRLLDMPYYKECAPLVEGMGFRLVSIRVEGARHGRSCGVAALPRAKLRETRSSYARGKGKVCCVIAAPNAKPVGVDECEKVHRALLARLKALLDTDDLSFELSSPGIERNIKNAAEFELFTGYGARLFVQSTAEWMEGKIKGVLGEEAVIIMNENSEVTVPYSGIVKARLA